MLINIRFEKDLSIKLALLPVGLAKSLLLVQTNMSMWDLITRIKYNLKMVVYAKSKKFFIEGIRNCATTVKYVKMLFPLSLVGLPTYNVTNTSILLMMVKTLMRFQKLSIRIFK